MDERTSKALENTVGYLACPAGITGKPCQFSYEYGDDESGRVAVSYYRDNEGRERLESRSISSGKVEVVLYDPASRTHHFCDIDRKTYSSSSSADGSGQLDIPVPQSQVAASADCFLNGNQVVPEPRVFELPNGLKKEPEEDCSTRRKLRSSTEWRITP